MPLRPTELPTRQSVESPQTLADECRSCRSLPLQSIGDHQSPAPACASGKHQCCRTWWCRSQRMIKWSRSSLGSRHQFFTRSFLFESFVLLTSTLQFLKPVWEQHCLVKVITRYFRQIPSLGYLGGSPMEYHRALAFDRSCASERLLVSRTPTYASPSSKQPWPESSTCCEAHSRQIRFYTCFVRSFPHG